MNVNVTCNKSIAAWFQLPGGLYALAVWEPGVEEGEIYADLTWQQNADDQTTRVANGRADDAVGGRSIMWLWQPEEDTDAIAGRVTIPRFPQRA